MSLSVYELHAVKFLVPELRQKLLKVEANKNRTSTRLGKKILEQGFLFYKDDEYYTESAVYEFSPIEIEKIEKATASLFAMCIEVIDFVITHQLWDEFCIPDHYIPLIEWSWKNRNPTIYGRFDLAYRGGEIKLLEFNADTPTLLFDSSVVQWHWLSEYNLCYQQNKDFDQFNNIHDKLLKVFSDLRGRLNPGKLHFTAPRNSEDFVTTKYLQDVAAQAGIETEFLFIEEIGIDRSGNFIDTQGNQISNIYKLYPYEWLFDEPFGEYLISNKNKCLWLEPPYKCILSNKMFLKYIYRLFPQSPYILPCVSAPSDEKLAIPFDYVKKPIFSREGENISILVGDSKVEETSGEYGEEGYIYQQYFELPEFDGKHPIIGSWIIGNEPAGFGIRESKGRITNVTSSFCAHYIAGGEG